MKLIVLWLLCDCVVQVASVVLHEDLENRAMIELKLVNTTQSTSDELSEESANATMLSTLSILLKVMSTVICAMFICSNDPARAPRCLRICFYMQLISAAIVLPVRPLVYQENYTVSLVICGIKIAILLYFLKATNALLKSF